MPAQTFRRRKSFPDRELLYRQRSQQMDHNVGTFGKVNYQQIYPGIDLVYYGTQRPARIRFHPDAGADPKQIALGIAGASQLLGPDGSLLLTLDGAPLTFANQWSIKPSLARRK